MLAYGRQCRIRHHVPVCPDRASSTIENQIGKREKHIQAEDGEFSPVILHAKTAVVAIFVRRSEKKETTAGN